MSQKKAQLLNPLNGNLSVTGVITASSFVGDGSGLTGVANTDFIVGTSITMTTGNFTGNVTIGGTLTYEDVTNVDSIGIITARSGIEVLTGGINVTGVSTLSGNVDLTGDIIVSAGGTIGAAVGVVTYYGDGSQLSGVVSGVEVLQAGSSVGTSITAINFAAGATLTGGSGFSTVTIAAGIQTEAATPNNTIQFLDLSAAQDHKLTVSGITTISVTGGTEGDSHTVRIINSGIATVGFSTYFLWPSGSPPSIPTADGTKSLVSFTVNRVGGAGTELFAGASVNLS